MFSTGTVFTSTHLILTMSPRRNQGTEMLINLPEITQRAGSALV